MRINIVKKSSQREEDVPVDLSLWSLSESAVLVRSVGRNTTCALPVERPVSLLLPPGKYHTNHAKQQRIPATTRWTKKNQSAAGCFSRIHRGMDA